MKLSEGEIEHIVREVIARLAPAPYNNGGKPESSTKGAAGSAATLLLEQPLVTLADLQGRLGQHTSVAISPGAVVTPAVRDWLHERKVPLVRRGAASQSGGVSRRLIVAVTQTPYDPREWMRQLSAQGTAIEPVTADGLSATIDRLVVAMSNGRGQGMLLTSEPAAAVCLANRQPKVRAAVATQVVDLEAAIRQVGPNLLIVDPRGQSLFSLRQMAARFCSGAPHVCPESLRARLENN